MFDLIEVTSIVNYVNCNPVHYQVTFEKSSISGRVQNIEYFVDGENVDLSDLWDSADIQELKNMVANYANFTHTVKEA